MDEKKAITYAELLKRNDELKRQLKDCRNQLCYECGSYRNAHEGACDDCRWKDEWRAYVND